MRYYYSLNNQPLGPIPLEELHQLYRSGTITAATLIVAEGGTEWKPYSTLDPQPADAPAAVVPPRSAEAEIPSEVASTSTPLAAPTASAVPPNAAAPVAPRSTQFTPPTVPAPSYKNLVLISWILLGGTALLSIIPVLGCLSWVMFIPIFIATVVMGFITYSRGGTRDGVLILVASIIVLPAFTFIAPIITTALFGAITGVGDKTKNAQSSPARTTSASPAATIAPATPALQATAAPELQIPVGAAATSMVNITMVNFKNAVNEGDFETFYRTQLSDLWRAETTPEQLATIFKTFVEKKIDLTPIFAVEPVLDPAPHIDENGMLVLKGLYPLKKEKVNVTFELSYSREEKWGLSGIKVNLKARPK